jgi:hypothetical protein
MWMVLKTNFILIKPEEESLNEKKFWHRVRALKGAWKKSIHEDMRSMWKWKLIELMKKNEFVK